MSSLFVYGTLKRGFANHKAVQGQREVAEATTVRRFPLRILTKYRVPWLVNRPGVGSLVTGELYTVTHPAIKRINRLEGVHRPGWFSLGTLYVRYRIDGIRRLVLARAYFGRRSSPNNRRKRQPFLQSFTKKHDAEYRSAA